MNFKEYKKIVKDLENEYVNIEFKIQSILIASIELNIEKNKGEEQLVRFDELRIIEEYIYKEKELVYFVSQFLENLNSQIDISNCKCGNTFYPVSNEKFSFYFDGLITQLYLLFESEQRVLLQHYFNKDKALSYYPNRNEFGLWWEVYMLRNRIVHYTGNRYLPGTEMCSCYCSFSSKCNGIKIDENGNININSTLIDIYKNNYIKEKIEDSIKTDKNPFDLLFPNKSAKGKNKKYPIVNFISNNIWFDYASSGMRLLNEIYDFLNSINTMFFDYIINQLNNTEKLINSNIILMINNKEVIKSIKELYQH